MEEKTGIVFRECSSVLTKTSLLASIELLDSNRDLYIVVSDRCQESSIYNIKGIPNFVYKESKECFTDNLGRVIRVRRVDYLSGYNWFLTDGYNIIWHNTTTY
jgi:hypothetical protein